LSHLLLVSRLGAGATQQPEDLLWGKFAQQDRVAGLGLWIAWWQGTYDQTTNQVRMLVIQAWPFYHSQYAPRFAGISDPVLDVAGLGFGPFATKLFTEHAIAVRKQPIDIVDGSSSRVTADQGLFACCLIQLQVLLCLLDECLEHFREMGMTQHTSKSATISSV